MNILLTGGLGYVGSHAAIELSESGHEVFLLDNLSNSELSTLSNLYAIVKKNIVFFEGDVRDEKLLLSILKDNNIEMVIHFAGLKSVNESVSYPLEYYENNVTGSISLLNAMSKSGVKKLIFSSSASVYGKPLYVPIDESHPLNPINPYAQTKKYVEEIMTDVARSDQSCQFVFLRYFNPVGAHSSGLIGENARGTPNNLVPFIAKVAKGVLPCLTVFGSDYATHDGTGIRDYIHVVDLAKGHLAAISYFDEGMENPAIFNLGTGFGVSVLEMIQAYEAASNKKIKFKKVSRRAGDVAECYANNSRASVVLKWHAVLDLKDMCESSWKYTASKFEIIP